jgi:deoxyribodipyrimidine photo-lyase
MNTLFAEDEGLALFPPTPAAARARLAAIHPAEYARTRNAIDGAVTRLSPYVSAGFITLHDVVRVVHARKPLDVQHKLIYELGWRAWFRHVWQHEGDGIFRSLHAGPLPDAAYAQALPADIEAGQTGVPAIDQAIDGLYRTGWMHNHARMWLASYVVHLRRVHWKVGADWLYGHLLDGDLASNHLSWQWVAGTGSHKPYLFNADNVARYAPADWHSPMTVIDASYEALERIARGGRLPPAPGRTVTPALPESARRTPEPPAKCSPSKVPVDAIAQAVRGRPVWIAHPWCLAEPPTGFDGLVVAIVPADDLSARPWSVRRWQFVGERLRVLSEHRWCALADVLVEGLAAAASVHGVDDPHLPDALRRGLPNGRLAPPLSLFAEPARRCASFSQFWARVSRGLADTGDLMADAARREGDQPGLGSR